jgi:hypothetical protein
LISCLAAYVTEYYVSPSSALTVTLISVDSAF